MSAAAKDAGAGWARNGAAIQKSRPSASIRICEDWLKISRVLRYNAEDSTHET